MNMTLKDFLDNDDYTLNTLTSHRKENVGCLNIIAAIVLGLLWVAESVNQYNELLRLCNHEVTFLTWAWHLLSGVFGVMTIIIAVLIIAPDSIVHCLKKAFCYIQSIFSKKHRTFKFK